MANWDPNLNKLVVISGQPDSRLLAVLPIAMGRDVGIDSGNYIEKDRTNFAPRIGLAFRPLGTSRFVVRSAYGIFYNFIAPGWALGNISANPPFIVSESFEPEPGSEPSLTFANPFPGSGKLGVPTNPSVFALARDYRTLYQQHWNFTLEYEVLRNTAVRASYVGNKATHLERSFNINDPIPAPGPVQPRRPFQPWGSISYRENGRNVIMNSLQLAAVRRFSSGLEFQLECQFQRSLGEAINDNPPSTDNRNARLDRGNLDFNRRHYAALNYMYELPFGKGKRFLSSWSGSAEKVIGGWQLTGIWILGTSRPYSVNFTSTTLGWPSSRADVLRGVPRYPDNKTIDRWFNPDAFAVPQPSTYGNSAPNSMFGPNFVDWDLGLFKNIALSERYRLQFRAEFFNALNHTNFRNPARNISVPATVGRITGLTIHAAFSSA